MSAGRQVDVEVSIFALQREGSPQSGSLEAPEGILFADPAGVDHVVGQIEVGATLRVLEERLIVADLTRPDARAEMQHLIDAVHLAVDRSHRPACGERHVLIPGEARKQR